MILHITNARSLLVERGIHMAEKRIVFYNKLTGDELSSIPAKDTSDEEVKATAGLLAFENGLDESKIEIKVVE